MKYKNFGKRVKEFLTLRSIGAKLLISIAIDSIIIGVAVLLVFSRFSMHNQEDLMLTKLKTDINYLEDIISRFGDDTWHIKDGALYMGDVLIGDGTAENANTAPFYEAEELTGTFVYTFMKCSDEGLGWYGDKKTGYQEGHFIRVAGSTKGPNGEEIVGTYMSKTVADILDSEGEYSGEANVAGGQIFCYYRTCLDENGNVVGATVVGRSMTEIKARAHRAANGIVIIVIIVIVLGGIGLFVTSSRWARSVEKVVAYLKRIGAGELPEDKLKLHSHDEIDEVAYSINDMVESLRDKQRIGSELNVATHIQADMLPSVFPPFPNRNDFELFASMNPAKEVGGDFYDFFMVDWDHLALVVADVSGKGVPAALFMVVTKTLIKDHSMLGLDPGEILSRTNELLCENNKEMLFVTGWIGIVELSTGKVVFANAGHNPPLVCRNGEYEYLKEKAGFVLGGMKGIRYKTQEMTLTKGDAIYLYTDGVTESTNASNELYGEDRLLQFINAHKDNNAEDLCKAIKKDTEDFTGEAPQFDDVTMVSFRYYGGIKQHEIVVDAKIENIPKVMEFVEEELDRLGATMKAKMQIDVAIDEIASNIAFYAYGGNDGFMKVNMEEGEDPTKVNIKFIDGGMPYNPLEREAPDITLSAAERKIGGLGIHIVRKTMDDVKYRFDNNKNVLVLTKTIK